MTVTHMLRKLRDKLMAEFDGKCAYCGCSIEPVAFPQLEHFYPKSQYPDRLADEDNLLLVCPVCNASKADQFPLDDDGNPLLLNPHVDEFSEHLTLKEDGTLVSTTPRGQATIEILNLNRPPLIAQRKLDQLQQQFLAQSRDVAEDPAAVFRSSIVRIRTLEALELKEGVDAQYLVNLLYSNVITALETYLSDRFIGLVTSSPERLRSFTESFHDFREHKFDLCSLFEKYDAIEQIAIDAMREVMYHNLAKVKGMYESTFDITFPGIATIARKVNIRHDLVHRNGKSKEGVSHKIEKDDVQELSEDARLFVEELESTLSKAT